MRVLGWMKEKKKKKKRKRKKKKMTGIVLKFNQSKFTHSREKI